MLVYGAGAIGCLLGARLADAGHDVTLLGRARLAEAVAEAGLRIEGRTESRPEVTVWTSPRAQAFDAVFVTCKAHATAQVAAEAARLAGDGFVASLQNGIGNDRKLLAHTPRVALALTSHGVMRTGPASFRHGGEGPTVVGVPAGAEQSAAVKAQELLRAAGFDPQWSDDVRAAAWSKAAVNAAINPLAAVHGATNGQVLEDHWPQAQELAQEVWSLSRAAGVGIGDPVAATRSTLEATAQNRCSMLQDVEARRPTEIDQITGYFTRAARRLGYPLFLNERIYRQLTALEVTYLGEERVLARARQEAEAWTL